MFLEYLENFELNNSPQTLFHFDKNENNKTIVKKKEFNNLKVTYFVNEFWTSKQRQASSLHEISYRACFKPQLPLFFIEKLTKEEDFVYDPFLGRGTTIIEAALMNRKVIGNDVNPLSKILAEPRLLIPNYEELVNYLERIPFKKGLKADIDLSMFYHPDTESEIVSLRNYILNKETDNELNQYDKWIRMVATNRLTGHSKGFFSVYTMPPNQAVLPERQIKINEKRNQKPEYRNVKELILKKTKSLIRNVSHAQRERLKSLHKTAIFLNKDARETEEIPENFVQLTVTSPPFLDVVQYAKDNWLRGWFNGVDINEVEKKITMSKTIDDWTNIMQGVFDELFRITKQGGYVAFEVGEVKNGKIRLEEHVVHLGINSGFNLMGVTINEQKFTKTANIWGVKNNNKGTNSNRIVLFKKGM
jgi:DNA modification methylase